MIDDEKSAAALDGLVAMIEKLWNSREAEFCGMHTLEGARLGRERYEWEDPDEPVHEIACHFRDDAISIRSFLDTLGHA